MVFCKTVPAQCLPDGYSGEIGIYAISQFYTISPKDTAHVSVAVCFTAESPVEETTDLTLTLPEEMPEITLAGGDFSVYGERTVDLDGTKGCTVLSVLIGADSTVTPGDIISIPVTADIPSGFYDRSDTARSTIHLYVVEAAAPSCTCQEENGNVNFKGNVKLSDAIANGAFGDPNSPLVLPPCISVNGTLTVDVPNFDIEGCEILMGRAAHIEVLPGSTLNLRENHIHGCYYLWFSIAKYGSGTLLAEDNTIEDGLLALQYTSSMGVPTACINGNVFNKDFVGISTMHIPFSQVDFKCFSGNVFTCENESLLNTFIPGISAPKSLPPAESTTFAGVYLEALNNTANLSGLPSAEKNWFHHIQNGIIADATNSIVKYARFDHIPVNDDYEDTLNVYGIGTGIYSTGTLTQEGAGMFSDPPSFESVITGIYVGGSGIVTSNGQLSSISIKKNHMEDVETGIRIQKAGGLLIPSLNVISNSIFCDEVGIYLSDVDEHTITDVSINRVYVDSDAPVGPNYGVGIAVSGSDLIPLNGAIHGNEVNMYKTGYGINLNMIEAGSAHDNVVYLHTAEPIAGIQVEGSRATEVHCNEVRGVSPDFIPRYNIAININNSPGCDIRCNQMDSTGVGLRLTGVCAASPSSVTQTNIRGNSFNEHGYGFLMESDAVFGSMFNQNIQAHKGNRWYGVYNQDRAVHLGFLNQIYYSRFRVHIDDLPFYPQSDDTNNPIAPMPPTPNATGVPWFEIMNDGSPFDCDMQCNPFGLTGEYPDSINAFGLDVAKDNLSFTTEYDAAMKESLVRQLYRVLDDYPALLDQDSALLQLHTEKSASAVGAFTAIDRLKRAALEPDSAGAVQLRVWENAIQVRLDSIAEADENFPAEPDSADIVGLQTLRETYLLEIDSFIGLQRLLACTLLPFRIALIDSALALNGEITAGTDMEDNEYKTNRVYLTKVFHGNYALSETEKGWLESIASQCPTLGGDAVFKARNMLRVIDGPYNYDDDSLCQVSAPKPLSQPAIPAPKPGDISVFPNPAGDWITVQVAGSWAGNLNFRIADALGNNATRAASETTTANNHPVALSTGDLPPGLFVVQVFHEGQLIGTKKFVKIR